MIDEAEPCISIRRLTTHVSNALQYQVNRKYVRRLMKELGLKVIYCKRNTSKQPRFYLHMCPKVS